MLVTAPFTAALDRLRSSLSARLVAAREDEQRERGASVVEWVVITTIVVVLAIGVGFAISNALTTKSATITGCINSAGTSNQCANGN